MGPAEKGNQVGALHTEYIAFQRIFAEYVEVRENVFKTIFIPLWPMTCKHQTRQLIRELCPMWGNIRIETKGKYLGMIIGPEAANTSWDKPLIEFLQRIDGWSKINL